MCVHPLHDALGASRDGLRQTIESLTQVPLSLEAAQCAVRQTRMLTAELAEVADALANQVSVDLASDKLADSRTDSGPVDQTLGDIVEDLRAMTRRLAGGNLLLEPAEEDLAFLRVPYPGGSGGRFTSSGQG